MELPLVRRIDFCNCPDFSGRQDTILITQQLSLSRDRDWSQSNHGPKITGTCKHVYAVQLLRGETPLREAVADPRVEGGEPLRMQGY